MNTSSIHGDRMLVIPRREHEWPRDFDCREAYAEQRELLAAPVAPTTSTVSTETERND